MVIENNKVIQIDLCDEGVENLRVAIITTAITDYKNPKNSNSRGSIERFLLSNWGQLLSNNLGDYIVKNLKKGC